MAFSDAGFRGVLRVKGFFPILGHVLQGVPLFRLSKVAYSGTDFVPNIKRALTQYANSEDSDQPEHLCSLIRAFSINLFYRIH